MVDWSDGAYEHTARALAPVALRCVETAGISHGDRVLDLGCGTGNAALEAARRGATVTAVDPAARLLEVARQRAAHAGMTLRLLQAEAGCLPLDDGSIDQLVSVFAVIFAPDAERAAAEMTRVVRPGGRIVLTSWVAHGPVAEAGSLLRTALQAAEPPRTSPPWGRTEWVRALFANRCAHVSVGEETIKFEAASAEAWFAEQEEYHPAWRLGRRLLSKQAGTWESLRARSLELLRAGNEATDRWRVTSPYLLVTVTR